MNSLDETARVRTLAFDGMRSRRDETLHLAMMLVPFPVAVHGILAEPTTALGVALGVIALVVSVTAGMRYRRLRSRPGLRVAARPGPGVHRFGWLSVPLILAAMGAGLISLPTAALGSALALLVALVVVPRHEAAQVAALQRRISGTHDPFARPSDVAVDFDAPGATTLAALLQLTRAVSLAQVAPALGHPEDQLIAAARSLEAQGAAVTADLKVPGRAPSLLVKLTPTGLDGWQHHVAGD